MIMGFNKIKREIIFIIVINFVFKKLKNSEPPVYELIHLIVAVVKKPSETVAKVTFFFNNLTCGSYYFIIIIKVKRM